MEKKATACKVFIISKDISKIVGMFSKTFTQNIYSAYLVCAHPFVIKKNYVKNWNQSLRNWCAVSLLLT